MKALRNRQDLFQEEGILSLILDAIDKMNRLKSPADDHQWGFAMTVWQNNFASLIPQFGGHFFDKNGNSDLANPGNIAAMEFLHDLFKKKRIPPPENALGWTGYRQGKIGMVWEGVYMMGDLKTIEGMDYAAAPIPQLGPFKGTQGDSHFLCIRKGIDPQKREAAERFIKYLSDHSIEWAAAGQVPARESVRKDPAFAKMKIQSEFAKMVPYVMYPPKTVIQFELGGEVTLAVESVMRDRKSAKEALEFADKNVQRFIDRDRKAQAFNNSAKGGTQ